MTIVAIEQAQKDLPRLIDDVAKGEHVVITRDDVPVAELVPVPGPGPRALFGSAKGLEPIRITPSAASTGIGGRPQRGV